MDSVTEEGEKVVFTEDAWKKRTRKWSRCFLNAQFRLVSLRRPGCTLSPLNYWRQHSQYFTGKNQLMYLNSGLEGEEAAYITSADGFYKLRGYSIYYERNQMMQDYMVQQKDSFRAESGVNDKVIQDFKQKMDERKYEAGRHRSTVGVLTGVCSVLAVTVLAGGVAMFSNYQKLHRMESVIAPFCRREAAGRAYWQQQGRGTRLKMLQAKAGLSRTNRTTSLRRPQARFIPPQPPRRKLLRNPLLP